MKKIITTLAAILIIITANAQDAEFNRSVFNATATIVAMLCIMVFILAIMKKIIDYRLKNKIVDKGISDSIASSILQTKPSDDRHVNIKWFSILAGLGAGLMIVNYTQPMGIHSLAIMSFSISASFLCYHLFTRQSTKD